MDILSWCFFQIWLRERGGGRQYLAVYSLGEDFPGQVYADREAYLVQQYCHQVTTEHFQSARHRASERLHEIVCDTPRILKSHELGNSCSITNYFVKYLGIPATINFLLNIARKEEKNLEQIERFCLGSLVELHASFFLRK